MGSLLSSRGVFDNQKYRLGAATPAFGMTMSTVLEGANSTAALNAATMASHDVTSVWMN